ncbi:transposase [Rhodopirellula maiorica SM1]|uniref:Transposase n=1 Tax=Rhodopirellula maiorica SM1 TaxID=1265738 RepID=M5RNX0_9BACT|nr:transposase [Rhodopirellula maiorica SM1]
MTTTVGLKVMCELARKAYRSGQKATESFRQNEPTIRDKVLGQFNYVLRP